MSRVGGLYMKNRKDLEKLFRIKAVKNKVNIAKEISGEELSEWI